MNPYNGGYMFATRNPGYMPDKDRKGEKSKSEAAMRLYPPYGEGYRFKVPPNLSSTPIEIRGADRYDEEIETEEVNHWVRTNATSGKSIYKLAIVESTAKPPDTEPTDKPPATYIHR